jgi:tripartite-type tricarboxylate transporter receptor subunit TctC
MKKILFGLLIAVTALTINAQTFNNKEIVIITSFPVGSGPDSLLREIQPDLQKIYNATVIVENKPGGNGAVAFDACNRGSEQQKIVLCYTEAAVFWGIPKVFGNNNVTKNLKFFAVSHFAPLVLVTSDNVTDRQQLIEHIKKHPNFGSWAVGSVGQITGQELSDYLKIATEHVPYKDYGQWLLDVANKNLGFSFPTLGSATPLYRAGKIKFIAVASTHRDPVFSDVPTMEEYFPGLKNFVPLGAYGAFYINKDTPIATEKILLAGMQQALANPNLKSSLIIRGYRPWTKNNIETRKILDAEQAHYYQALTQFNINVRQ